VTLARRLALLLAAAAQEMVFCLDLAARVAGPPAGESGLYGRYRQRSQWDLASDDALLRVETRFTPEAGALVGHDLWSACPRRLAVSAAFLHESNGQQGASSRGWNRIALGAHLGGPDDALRASLVAWHAFRVEDNNPDLRQYAGDGELVVDWRARRPAGPRAAHLRLQARVAFTVAAGAPRALPHTQLEIAWRPGGLPAWLLGPADGPGLDLFLQAHAGTGEFLNEATRETGEIRGGLALRTP